jgi:cytochrome c-type biogenesis protein
VGVNIPFDRHILCRQNSSLNYGSSAMMGVFFSAGWAPCVGPVLGVVLTLALNTGSLNQGVVLLTAYSAGLAIPFLLAALGIGRAAELMRQHARTVRIVSRVTGVVMVIVGVLLFTGTLEQLARFGFFVNLGL